MKSVLGSPSLDEYTREKKNPIIKFVRLLIKLLKENQLRTLLDVVLVLPFCSAGWLGLADQDLAH